MEAVEEEGGQPQPLHARHIKKRALRNKALSVSFNEKDLRDFVGGFHKRKKKRRKEAQQQLQESQRIKRIEQRKKAIGSSMDGERWDAEGDHPAVVKELGSSKWSNDLDEDDTEKSEGPKENLNALSGLIQAYSKGGKSVHWGDQAGNTGFSIGTAKKANSLVIGPGAGYNLKSNPLPEEENSTSSRNTGESKRQSIFQEQLRAERESFRAVFDRRRHRIGVPLPDADEES